MEGDGRKPVMELEGHASYVNCIEFDPQGIKVCLMCLFDVFV